MMTETQLSCLADISTEIGVLNQPMREQAFAVLNELDFPTTKVEAWKYTRVAKLSRRSFSDNQDSVELPAPRTYEIQFLNGRLAGRGIGLEALEDIQLLPIQQASNVGTLLTLNGEIFHSINTAYATDGIAIHVPANVRIQEPIEITHYVTGQESLVNIRHYVHVGRQSELTVNMRYLSLGQSNGWVNPVCEIEVEDGAHLTLNKFQNENETTTHISTEQVHQADNSNFTINTITLGGGLVRNNLNIAVDGTNCETNLYGAYVLNGQQHVDNHTVVDHLKPHCNSNELYKGVMDDKSTGVFNGKVFVRPDAQKINAFQSNGNVLLTDVATINSKPELEIYADDVKCSHGSTTGQLDEEAIFYLRARGISEKSAKQLMIGAFIGEVIEHISEENFKNEVIIALENAGFLA